MKKITLLVFLFVGNIAYGQCNFNVNKAPSPANPLLFGFSHNFSGVVTSIVWYFGDGDSSTLNAPTHLYAGPGIYSFSVKINACPLVGDTLKIQGQIDCNFTLNSVNPGGPPLGYLFTSTVLGVPDSVYWDFGDGDTSAQLAPYHEYVNPGVYTYCLNLDSCPIVCDTIVTYGVGIDEHELQEVSVYPNPVNDYMNVTFNLESRSDINIKVYSLSGSLVIDKSFKGEPGENRKSIRMADLTSGVYMVQLIEGKSIRKNRIVKL